MGRAHQAVQGLDQAREHEALRVAVPQLPAPSRAPRIQLALLGDSRRVLLLSSAAAAHVLHHQPLFQRPPQHHHFAPPSIAHARVGCGAHLQRNHRHGRGLLVGGPDAERA
eukprot:41351-Rhodomonas_salina.1